MKCVYCSREGVLVEHVRGCAKVHHERQGSGSNPQSETRDYSQPKTIPCKPGGSLGESLPQSSQLDSAGKSLKKSAPDEIDTSQCRGEAFQAINMFDEKNKLSDSRPFSQIEVESTKRWLPGGTLSWRPTQRVNPNQEKPLPGKREKKGKNSAKRSGRSSSSGQVWDEPVPYGTIDPRY